MGIYVYDLAGGTKRNDIVNCHTLLPCFISPSLLENAPLINIGFWRFIATAPILVPKRYVMLGLTVVDFEFGAAIPFQ